LGLERACENEQRVQRVQSVQRVQRAKEVNASGIRQPASLNQFRAGSLCYAHHA